MKFTRVAFLFTLWHNINKGEVHSSGKGKAKWKLNPKGNYVKNVRRAIRLFVCLLDPSSHDASGQQSGDLG